MTDPKHTPTQEEDDAAELKPELERETLKDLTPQAEQAEGVKGGDTTYRRGDYQCETTM